MSNVFFTSDHHFFHKNCMKFYPDTRGQFSSIDELNEHMISNWNELIKYNDEVYYLGDLSFAGDKETSELLHRLNGNIYYIKGNHDKGIQKHIKRFIWLKDIAEITVNGIGITICHYAMRTWNKSHFGNWHLYGHSHGSLPEDPIAKSMDIGVDTNKFYPYHFDEIKDKLDKKPGYLIHHGKDRS